MRGKKITLTESQLRKVIKESINDILNEEYSEYENQVRNIVNDAVKKLRSIQMLARIQKSRDKFFDVCNRGDELINDLMKTLDKFGYELEFDVDYDFIPTHGDNFQMITPSIYGGNEEKIVATAINNLITYEQACGIVEKDLKRKEDEAKIRQREAQDEVNNKRAIWGDDKVDNNGFLKGGKYTQPMQLPKVVGHIDL